jgi:hypothetical protein
MWGWLAGVLGSIGTAASEFGAGVKAGAEAGLTGAKLAKGASTFGTIGQLAGMRGVSKVAPAFQKINLLGELTGLGTLGGQKPQQPQGGESYIDPKTGMKKKGLFTPLF